MNHVKWSSSSPIVRAPGASAKQPIRYTIPAGLKKECSWEPSISIRWAGFVIG